MAELREKTEKEIEDYLRAIEKELTVRGVQKVSSVAAEGTGPEQIIESAKKSAGGVVAMSTHGRSGIGRWVLGSVTVRVLSDCGEPGQVIRTVPASKQ